MRGRLVHIKGNLRFGNLLENISGNQEGNVTKMHLVGHQGVSRRAPAQLLKDICHFERLFQKDQTLTHLQGKNYMLRERKGSEGITWT